MQTGTQATSQALVPDPTGFAFPMRNTNLPYCRLFMKYSEQLSRENLVFAKVVRELGRAHTLKRWPVVIDIGANVGWTERLGRAVENEGYKCHTTGENEQRVLTITLD